MKNKEWFHEHMHGLSKSNKYIDPTNLQHSATIMYREFCTIMLHYYEKYNVMYVNSNDYHTIIAVW